MKLKVERLWTLCTGRDGLEQLVRLMKNMLISIAENAFWLGLRWKRRRATSSPKRISQSNEQLINDGWPSSGCICWHVHASGFYFQGGNDFSSPLPGCSICHREEEARRKQKFDCCRPVDSCICATAKNGRWVVFLVAPRGGHIGQISKRLDWLVWALLVLHGGAARGRQGWNGVWNSQDPALCLSRFQKCKESVSEWDAHWDTERNFQVDSTPPFSAVRSASASVSWRLWKGAQLPAEIADIFKFFPKIFVFQPLDQWCVSPPCFYTNFGLVWTIDSVLAVSAGSSTFTFSQSSKNSNSPSVH